MEIHLELYYAMLQSFLFRALQTADVPRDGRRIPGAPALCDILPLRSEYC